MGIHAGLVVWTVFVVIAISSNLSQASEKVGSGANSFKGGYWPASTGSTYPASTINATLYTHLFYAFVFMDTNTYKLSPGLDELFATFPSTVRAIEPDVKTMISIQMNDKDFLLLVNSTTNCEIFINSSIQLAREHGFDGLDFDLEWPSSDTAMRNLSTLLTMWRNRIDEDAKSLGPLILTQAVYYTPELLYSGGPTYPVESLKENLDFVNIMSYDYNGAWTPGNTGSLANLYGTNKSRTLNTDFGITSWLSAGLPADMAVMGLAMYGRSWTLKDQKVSSGIGAEATGPGPLQPMSASPGVFYYSEVVSFIESQHATVGYDNETVSVFCYADNVWVSYENPDTISLKVSYLEKKQLKGYFFWATSFDSDSALASTASRTLDALVMPGQEASAPSSSLGSMSAVQNLAISLLLCLLATLFS